QGRSESNTDLCEASDLRLHYKSPYVAIHGLLLSCVFLVPPAPSSLRSGAPTRACGRAVQFMGPRPATQLQRISRRLAPVVTERPFEVIHRMPLLQQDQLPRKVKHGVIQSCP